MARVVRKLGIVYSKNNGLTRLAQWCRQKHLLKLVAGLATGDAITEFECSDGTALFGRVIYGATRPPSAWLSVIDNVLLGDRLRTSHEPIRLGNAYELLDRVGLRAYAAELPVKLSGGMRQRAALVRTLMEDKPVVVMDEPFSALDAITRLKLQDMAADLLTNRTVFSSHMILRGASARRTYHSHERAPCSARNNC